MSEMFEPGPAAARAPGPAPTEPGEETSFFRRLGQQGAEAWEYARYYLSAKLDSAKLTIREAVIAIVLGLLGGLVVVGFLLVACYYVVAGLAEGLGQWLEAPWLGKLLAGLGVLILFAATLGIGLAVAKKQSYRQTREKYEQRQRQQQARFGQNVIH